jgi:hypothetical protein
MNSKNTSFEPIREIRDQSDTIPRRLDEVTTRLGAVERDPAA